MNNFEGGSPASAVTLQGGDHQFGIRCSATESQVTEKC